MASPDGPDGIVLVDKPAGWTSHDVVARMRRVLGTRKVGHGGTLDPMATGLLVVAAGRATRLLTYYSAGTKAYEATVRLGASTITDDAEGEVVAVADASGVAADAIAGAVAALTGDIMQRPSSVSAIKVDGQRAYARVRGGEDVELAARPVTVSQFDVLETRLVAGEPGHAFVDLDIAVTVSSGTYVRALARDLGDALGVGGHLTALRRTQVGGLGLDGALTVDQLTAIAESGEQVPLVSLAGAASAILPVVEVSAAEATSLGYGQLIAARPGVSPEGDAVAMCAEVAVAVIRAHQGKWKPAIVFEPARSAPPGAAQ